MIPRKITARFLTLIVLSSFLCGFAGAQRAIVNPSIETPAFADSQFFWYAESVVDGWLTTHPVTTNGCSNGGATNNIDCRPIERWSNGFNSTFAAPGAGSRWVELNAYDNSMIYQSVCMTNGETFGYSFLHRGRASNVTPDVAQFRIGIPTGLPPGSIAADSYDFPIVQVSSTNIGLGGTPTGSGVINSPVVDAPTGWVRYSGSYTYTGATQVVNMGFRAVSTAGGILGSGNFIDDWQVTLNPYLEFATASAAGNEGTFGTNTPANRPAIRVGGTVVSPVTVSFQVSGGSAQPGIDYSLTVPFAPGNTTTTASVTIPAGSYDGSSAASLFPIPFSIATDNQIEADDTVDFALVNAPGATIASVAGCGVAPTTSSSYQILNDDIVTAAGAEISGRVLTHDGRGVSRAVVTITDANGRRVSASTNTFGHFRFANVEAGASYMIDVSARPHRFETQMVTVFGEISGLDLFPAK